MHLFTQSFHQGVKISDKSFLVTGGAGFIGSHITDYLVLFGAKKVVVLDNLSSGFEKNYIHHSGKPNFEFIKGDITNYETCFKATQNIDIVIHQAALGSVPRSIKEPIVSHAANATGFLNMLFAAKENNIW